MTFIYEIFGYPLGFLMSLIYNLVNNYAVAIILFTLVTKLILSPVNYITQKNAARTRLLNPKIAKLRKSYANNTTKLQEETQKLYQQEGINQMASCLPSIIQMLLLFGVLDVVYKPMTHILRLGKNFISSIIPIASNSAVEAGGKIISDKALNCELRSMEQIQLFPDKFGAVDADKISTINDFYDKFTFFGANLGKTPSFHPDQWNKESIILFIIPWLAGIAQFLYSFYTTRYQKKNNPDMPNMGCMNVMFYFMPLMSVWFAYMLPAGVGFYWIWSSVASFFITFGLNIYFNDERVKKINEKEKEKARIYAEKHPEKKTFMQRLMEQQAALEAQQNGKNNSGRDGKISRSEMNKVNRDRIAEARKRMAEKYGDEYTDNNDED